MPSEKKAAALWTKAAKRSDVSLIADYPEVSPRTIYNFRQNHPELVVRDLQQYLRLSDAQVQFVRDVLMARGVNKWLKVRRDLIAYKKQIRHQIKAIEAERATLPRRSLRRRELLIRSKALQEVRHVLKGLCMTPRWQEWPINRPISTGLRAMNTRRTVQ